MGDAGPPTPPSTLAQQDGLSEIIDEVHDLPVREIRVLVTGFGPFKSFLINPSWLITSALPDELQPHTTSILSDPASKPTAPYKIRILIHPSPVRVAYDTVNTTFPDLLAQHDPDFVLHIGMAGGRDCYSLETRAHRDGYRIKDVDDCDGFSCGEVVWKREGVPDCLLVSWDEDEVLRRWEQGVERGLNAGGFLSGPSTVNTASVPSKGIVGSVRTVWGTVGAPPVSRAEEHRKKGVVKLSRDAGRFLCEFALFESLSLRWLEATSYKRSDLASQSPSDATVPTKNLSAASDAVAVDQTQTDEEPDARRKRELALERLGKVAFLHVPGWTGAEDISRGVMVAEEAIRSLVGSWEDGFRRDRKAKAAAPASNKFTDQNSEIDMGSKTAVVRGEVILPSGVGVGIEDLGRVRWRD